MGIFPKYPVFFVHSATKRLQGAVRSADRRCGPEPREGTQVPRRRHGLTYLCGQRPHFFLPQGEALSAPHSLFRGKRERAAWRSKRKAPGAPRLNDLHEARMGPWIPPCWVRTLPASRVGVSGVLFGFRRGRRHQTPDDFSLVPPGGTISFSKKEMVGPTVPRLEGGFSRPAPVARNIQRLEALLKEVRPPGARIG